LFSKKNTGAHVVYGNKLAVFMAAGAVSRLRNRTIMGAWSGWLEFCELRQEKREQLAAAVTFWTHRELAAAFHQFRWISVLA
jgi:hypothetical protein